MNDEERKQKRRDENKALKQYLRGRLPTIAPDGSVCIFSDGSTYKMGTNQYGGNSGLLKIKGKDNK